MRNILVVLLVAILLVISNSIFTVDERELALKFRFGEVIKSKFKCQFPLIHSEDTVAYH
jgi:regulator of protease activity HflC (stomatin/prohibitin superfamily)